MKLEMGFFQGTLRHAVYGFLNKHIAKSKVPVALRYISVDYKMLKDELDDIEKNVLLRKHKNNVPIIRSLLKEFYVAPDNFDILKRIELEINKLPNNTHERLICYGETPREIYKNDVTLAKVEEFSAICKSLSLMRMEHLGHFTGHKSYYLLGDLAVLEQSLVRQTMSFLKGKQYRLISVPDILTTCVINGCGMSTEGDRTQVYKLKTGECLSGTSELAMAGYFSGDIIDEEKLPIKFAAVSRCYRAETSGLADEKGIYRVHQFTKVEMFALCTQSQSEGVLESFKNIEVSLYEQLNLSYKVLDMPPIELGASAYQKYDIEAWFPGRQMWGEVSSCSNCTDYQAKRLNIRYCTKDGKLKYVHTVNGTAAAIPRLLIALVESNKIESGTISIPKYIKKVFNAETVKCNRLIPGIKLIKCFKRQS